MNLWRSDFGGQDVYNLANETILLLVRESTGPADVKVLGIDSLNDLNKTAQNAILAYFKKQETLYDIQTELEKAYTEYINCQTENQKYYDLYISQTIAPTASNSSIICFLTSVMLPASGRETREIRLGTFFDKD